VLLADLTPAELIMGEIPNVLELVSEVHDVLIRGPCIGILFCSFVQSWRRMWSGPFTVRP